MTDKNLPRFSATGQPFSTSTSLLFVLSLMFISIGIIAALGFVGQCALELPYHLYGKETTATVADLRETTSTTRGVHIRSVWVTVYYFTDEQPWHLLSSRLRGVERLAQDNLEQGSRIRVVYLSGNTETVMPKEVLLKAGEEIGLGLLGGLGIALPGAGVLLWLKKTGRLG